MNCIAPFYLTLTTATTVFTITTTILLLLLFLFLVLLVLFQVLLYFLPKFDCLALSQSQLRKTNGILNHHNHMKIKGKT